MGIFSGDSATEVELLLGDRAAGWVREDPWHPDQTLQPVGGSSEDKQDQRYRLTVPASHPRELLPKVLSLGGDAEVVRPAEFRKAVADSVARMAAAYHD